jgi:hypothetical protein
MKGISMLDDLLLSERVYIALYAHTGKWRAKRLPAHVIELGRAERAKHKRGERCMGCEMQTLTVEITLG